MNILYSFIFVFSILSDQFSKYWALNSLKNKDSIKLIGDFLRFTYAENKGAAFSILQDRRWFFVIITVSVLVLLAFVFFRNKKLTKLSKLAIVMISGGAIGNFIDRLRLGFVIDFIDVRFFGYYNFPIFNIADSFVVCGTILMAILIYCNKFETSENNG